MSEYFEEKYADCANIKKRMQFSRRGENVCAAPVVSVIIPAYNISRMIAATLASVFAQTFRAFEVVVVNDGSPDTIELVKALAPFFDQIVYAEQINAGASTARNLAICLSRGNLLAFLDGDDLWMPEFLASQIEFLEQNNLDMVYCDADLFGETVKPGETFMRNSPSSGAVTPGKLISGKCNVITSGTILRREKLAESEMFDTSLKRMQDFDLWFRLAKLGAKIGYQKKILVKYRVSNTSLSGTNVERARRNISALKVIRDKYKLNAEEKLTWTGQMILSEAEYELEQGKFSLTQKDYSQAQKHFKTANRYFRNPKISAITFFLQIAPGMTLSLFKKLRPSEYSFIAAPPERR